jgi:hypothetical protein
MFGTSAEASSTGDQTSSKSLDEKLAAAVFYASKLVEFLSQSNELIVEDNIALLSAHPAEFLSRREALGKGTLELMQSAAEVEPDPLNWLLRSPEGLRSEMWNGDRAAEWFAKARELGMPRLSVPDTVTPRPKLEPTSGSKKKTHEIELFASLIARIASQTNCGTIVDAGSGLGRLGRQLSQYGLKVIGVERDPAVVQRAGNSELSTVSLGNLNTEGLLQLAESTPATSGMILVGLHACGELSSDLFRTFASPNSPYSAVVVAGCCYQHAETFPLSTTVEDGLFSLDLDPRTFLPKRARETAAQSASPEYLSTQSGEARKGIREKALARALLDQVHYEFHAAGLDCKACVELSVESGLPGKHPFDPLQSFSSYAAKALGPDVVKLRTDLDLRFTDTLAKESTLFATFSAMRHALGAVAESLIVLDRAAFVAEQVKDLEELRVVPLFDSGVSPRNLVVWATRKRSQCNQTAE